jgi:hypothetical protein
MPFYHVSAHGHRSILFSINIQIFEYSINKGIFHGIFEYSENSPKISKKILFINYVPKFVLFARFISALRSPLA